MNEVIEYENSPQGFFSLLAEELGFLTSEPQAEAGRAEAVYRRRGPSPRLPSQGGLFDGFGGTASPRYVSTDTERAGALIDALKLVDPLCPLIAEYAWRSERPIEASALSYARIALAEGRLAAMDEARPPVREVRLAWRHTRKELDRFMGILRFEREAAGLWVASCEPAADILDLLAAHFERRMGGEAFLIRDEARGREAGGGSLAPSTEAFDSRGLWRLFYRTAENESRRNGDLRARLLPRRYWKNLPELDDSPDAPSAGG